MGRVRGDRGRWEWAPLLLLGAAAASAGELAAGLLLYSSEGFLRALTLVLATELAALALGLWAAPGGDDPVEPVRRRWLFVLVTFTAAAAFSGAWALLEGFAAAPFAQGLGLAVLAGLPLYAVGTLLAAPGVGGDRRGFPDEVGRSSRAARVGAAATLGGALGVLLTGVVLVPLEAPSVLLLWLVILSGAALLHGWILDGRTVVRSVETVASPYGPVRVELWQRGSAGLEYRVVRENGRLRGGEDRAGRPVRAWEEGVAILTRERAGRLLFLGSGTGTLARLVGAGGPAGRVVAVERNAEVSRAARRHLTEGGTPGHELIHGDPVERLGELMGPFDAVVLDGAGVTPGDPVPLLSTGLLRELHRRLSSGGFLVMAPLPAREDGGSPAVEALLSRAAQAFPQVIFYSGSGGGRVGVEGEGAGFVLLPRDGGGEWPDRLGALEAERP